MYICIYLYIYLYIHVDISLGHVSQIAQGNSWTTLISCRYIWNHTYIYIYIYTHTHTYIYIHAYVCIFVFICMRIYHRNMWLRSRKKIPVLCWYDIDTYRITYMHTLTHMYIHICIYLYIHLYIYIQMSPEHVTQNALKNSCRVLIRRRLALLVPVWMCVCVCVCVCITSGEETRRNSDISSKMRF